MIITTGNEITGLIAPITPAEEALLPLQNANGVAYWVVNAPGDYHKRTDEELLSIFLSEHPEARNDRLQLLNNDLHAYLTERGYDEGTQLSFQAIYTDLLERQIAGQVKQKIRAAFDFLMSVVMPWYYGKKTELETTDNFLAYTWDFHDLDALDPGVSLREILTLLQ